MRGVMLAVGIVAACGDNARLSSDASRAGDAAADTAGEAAVDAPPDTPLDAGGDPNEGAISGTRLKLVWYQTADGVKTWIVNSAGPTFFDAQRAEDCRARLWADGATYCTPAPLQAVYTDAGCTTAVGQMPP